MILVSDLDNVHHPAKLQGNLILVGQLRLTAEAFVLADLRFSHYDETDEQALQEAGFLAKIHYPKRDERLILPDPAPTKYGHFQVTSQGHETTVTNTDGKPHEFKHDGELVKLQPKETRRFSSP